MNNEIKIGNIFKLPMIIDGQCCVMSADFRYQINFDDSDSNVRKQVECVCHAINNHDRLVEENKRLREVVLYLARSRQHSEIDSHYALEALASLAARTLSELDGEK